MMSTNPQQIVANRLQPRAARPSAPLLAVLCALLVVGCADPKPAAAPAAKADTAATQDTGAGQGVDAEDAAAVGVVDAATATDGSPATDDAVAPDAVDAGGPLPEGSYPKQPTVEIPKFPLRFAIPPDAKPGQWQDGIWVLPNGRVLTPAGKQVFLGAYPMGAAVHPGGLTGYIANEGKAKAVQVVDLTSGKVVQTLKKSYVYRWLAVDGQGAYLYASGGPKEPTWRFAIQPDGTLKDDKAYTTKNGLLGIALSPDGNWLYGVASSYALNKAKTVAELWRVEVATGTAELLVKLADMPYDVVVSPDGATAWVMNWLGGQLQHVDLTQGPAKDGQTAAMLSTALGFSGQGVAMSPDGKVVYASAVDGDFVAFVDAATGQITHKVMVNLGQAPGMAPQGRDPGFLRVSPDGKRVYVVCALSNEVAVIDTASAQLVGSIPVGWYPSGLALSADGKTLLVTNAKGTGFPVGWVDANASDGYMGTLSVIPIPKDDQLKAWQGDVLDNLIGINGLGRVPATQEQKQLLPDAGGSAQIKHVVYLMRENKTFDVQLGDLAGQVTGVVADPALALFGEEITPNLHKLAKEYCLLDNFYTDGDYSATGHSYAMAGKASDYIEKFYRLSDKGADIKWGVGPVSQPGRGFLLHNILGHGLTARAYGQLVGMIDAWTVTNVMQGEYPGLVFNMGVKDKEKASWYAKHIQGIDLPSYTFLSVPNNHTCCGNDPNYPSPKSMIADNDEATGLIVEALTKHKDWPSTVIFIFEDDSQDGGDSVEYHRSPLVVVSPFAKRGHLLHTQHAIGAIHATMERALGVTPLTEFDALASPIYGCFQAKADASSYQHVPRLYPEVANKDEPKKKWNKSLERQWQPVGPKSMDEHRGIGRLLWHMYKGSPAPWPQQRYTPEGLDLDDDD